MPLSQNEQNTLYVGDVGTKIVVNIGIPADDVILAKLKVKKPDKTVVEWDATPVSGTENVEYVIQEGDLDQEGKYELQAYIETATWKGHGTEAYFFVKQHL